MKSNHQPHDYLPVVAVVIFVLLVITGILTVSFFFPNLINPSTPTPTPLIVQQGTLIEVPFDYVITSINPDLITLTGDNGEFVLPNDDLIVTVTSLNPANQTYLLSSLIVGQSVNLKFIPGKSAEILVK